jgi:hypothetical protein
VTCINNIVLGQSMKLYSALVSTKSIIIACGDLELHKYIHVERNKPEFNNV